MKKRILIVGQAYQATGFARMSKGIAACLSQNNDVYLLGIDRHACREGTCEIKGVTVLPNESSVDVFAERCLAELVDSLQPDVILLFNDIWFLPRQITAACRGTWFCPIVLYCPVDGEILRSDLVASLRQASMIVTYTHFGRRVLTRCAESEGLGATPPFDNMAVIPHGIANKVFCPVDRKKARAAVFPHRHDLKDAFIIINANRNQPRKRIDLTLRGFAEFSEARDDAFLYLHMNPSGKAVDVRKLATELGITGKLLLPAADEHPTVSSHQLNLIYNACDVGLNTSVGEGWGLVSCEHAMTGAAQIVPNHSACKELWTDAACLLPIHKKSYVCGLLEGGIVTPAAVAGALEYLYTSQTVRKELGNLGTQRMQQFSWQSIAGMWEDVFAQVTNQILASALV